MNTGTNWAPLVMLLIFPSQMLSLLGGPLDGCDYFADASRWKQSNNSGSRTLCS